MIHSRSTIQTQTLGVTPSWLTLIEPNTLHHNYIKLYHVDTMITTYTLHQINQIPTVKLWISTIGRLHLYSWFRDVGGPISPTSLHRMNWHPVSSSPRNAWGPGCCGSRTCGCSGISLEEPKVLLSEGPQSNMHWEWVWINYAVFLTFCRSNMLKHGSTLMYRHYTVDVCISIMCPRSPRNHI